MKLVASAIVALFATVAFANPTATGTTTTETTATHETTAAGTAHAGKEMKATGPAKDHKAMTTKEDCSKMMGEAKTKCEMAEKNHK